jgi:hypothetical protein
VTDAVVLGKTSFSMGPLRAGVHNIAALNTSHGA